MGEESPAWQRFNQRQQELFYDHTLTIYSAPAHIVASRSGASDPTDAYRLAARAAGVALNFTPGLSIDQDLPRRFAPDDLQAPDARARTVRLLKRLDPGFLFSAIVMAAPPFAGDDDAWLAEGLRVAGLPSEDEIMQAAEQRLSLPTLVGMPRLWSIYMQCVTAGAGNFMRLRPSGGVLDFRRMAAVGTVSGPIAIPHVFLANGVMQTSAIPVLEMKDQQIMRNASNRLHEQLDELLAACR